MNLDSLHATVRRWLPEAIRINVFFSLFYFVTAVAVLTAIAFG